MTALLRKIIVNLTGSPVFVSDVGVTIPVGSVDIFADNWAEWSESARGGDFETLVDSDTLLASFGAGNLSKDQSKELIRWGLPQLLSFFDSSIPQQLGSGNVRDAILEALAISTGKPRLSIPTVHNATVVDNQWLGYSNLLPGDQVPIVVPTDASMREITFSYVNAAVDGKFQLYKNGLNPGDIVLTIQFTAQNSPLVSVVTGLQLSSDDTFVGRWVDEGQNPADMAITYFLQVL